MEEILKFDTITQYKAFNKNITLHPLVSVVDLSKADPRRLRRMSYGFYTIFPYKRLRKVIPKESNKRFFE
jgi:AraC family transcriptional activator of pobA